MEIDLSGKDAANSAGAEVIHLPILQIISEARNEHGMRLQDFERYRRYCSSKVHRLRETLHLTHADMNQKAPEKGKSKKTKGKKPKKAQAAAAQSAAAKGKGNVFTEKVIRIQDVDNERPALLLLFEAERAWAFSQDLRNQSFENDQDSALRRRGFSRARRAVQWSFQLYQLVTALSSRFDAHARAEAAAYATLLKASELFDKKQWEKALEHLSVSRVLLSIVADSSDSSRSEALANSFIDSGEAQMRYCAYQIGESEQEMDKAAERIATNEVCTKVLPEFNDLEAELRSVKMASSGAKSERALTLTWHGQKIPIRNPELLDSITKASDEEEALQRAIKAGDSQGRIKTSEKTKRTNISKRPRLSHSQRKAKKREAAAAAAQASGSSSIVASTSRVGGGGRTEMDPFDRALSALADAEEVARRLVEDNAEALAKSHSARYESASNDLRLAHDYIFYKLLALRVARNARLVEEVERKSERRDRRAQELTEIRLQRSNASRRRSKRSAKASSMSQEKAPKKSKPGSLAKRPRSEARPKPRPARSGTRALKARQSSARAARARLVSLEKSRRRSARAVPALAKLLDGAETSLSAMASIGLVESEPDVSSLIEAKAAWYRGELLRHLAKAFALSNARAEALLLATRAQLYVRQARQAAELAEDAEEEDGHVPPSMKDDATFAKVEEQLERFKVQTQKEIYLAERGRMERPKSVTAMNETKAGQALQELAAKYVDFDPVDVEEARRVPEHVADECERELSGAAGGKASKGHKVKREKKRVEGAGAGAKEANSSSTEEEEVAESFHDADSDDEPMYEAQAGDEEGEEEDGSGTNTPSSQPKKGWLGGWFGRGG
ncbi:hypothetical protein IE53DRAFT_387607 [Violaceomyces palustris]|uniref:Uncharacterized protein n=1 Tax=Violaceomyces palustris TaxID=1673888 RepID=A0ACD0NWB0_9BASI|nr:hypothetical protein IE53DRAFT_387607 [Violaceomyces palustris]